MTTPTLSEDLALLCSAVGLKLSPAGYDEVMAARDRLRCAIGEREHLEYAARWFLAYCNTEEIRPGRTMAPAVKAWMEAERTRKAKGK